jgi:hypothetical protein
MVAGPVLAFVPLYFGLRGIGAAIFIGLALVSLSIALMGAGMELSKEYFTGQKMWENLGIALGFAVLAGGVHLATVSISATWLVVLLKILVVLLMIVSAIGLGMALGHAVSEARLQGTEGKRRPRSWPALVGAFAIWLTTVGLNVAQIYAAFHK